MSWLAIDFGTCYSSAAYLRENSPVIVKFGANQTSLPSSVFIEDERILIGTAADNRGKIKPLAYRREFKRELGQKIPYSLNGRQMMPEDLIAEILRKFLEEWERQSSETMKAENKSVVLTVPAGYQKHKRELMKTAGQIAGFADVELLAEPVAAAIYYANRKDISEEAGKTILVYDLGGGTFDAALIRHENGDYMELAMSAGHDRLGGSDFDQAIFADMLEKCEIFRQEFSGETIAEQDEKSFVKRLQAQNWAKKACVDLKHHLSESEEAEEIIPWTGEEYNLKRTDFEMMIGNLIKQTCEITQDLIKSAGLISSEIDIVLLVGGSCRIPFVEKTISRELGCPVERVDDPELAVCLGGAIYSKRIAEKNKNTEIKSFYDQGVEELNNHNYGQAIFNFSKTIELQPEHSHAYQKRSWAYLALDDYDMTIIDCNKIIELIPNDTTAYNIRGIAYRKKGEYDKAVNDHKKAIEINFNDTFAHENLRLAEEEIRKLAEEIRAKEELEKQNRFQPWTNFKKITSDWVVRDKIKQILVDELGVDEAEVTENARFIEDLGADSLDLVELVMRFEEEFDIEIPDEDAEKIQSVRDAYAYIEQYKRQ